MNRKKYSPPRFRKTFTPRGSRYKNSQSPKNSGLLRGIFWAIALIIFGYILTSYVIPKIFSAFRVWQIEQEMAKVEEIFSGEKIALVDEEKYDEFNYEKSDTSAYHSETLILDDELESEVQKVDTRTPLQKFLDSLPHEYPEKKLLAVPFICQNPFQDTAGWDHHDESCEEAAAMQVVLYHRGETLTKQQAHEKFLDMISWQKKKEHFGIHKDLYNEDMRIFVRDYFEYADHEVIWIPDITPELMKRIITGGHPIIFPASGKTLANPFYPYPGYHMLTIIGYTPEHVMTNEVGTKRGERFPYPYKKFFQANANIGGGILVIVPDKGKKNTSSF